MAGKLRLFVMNDRFHSLCVRKLDLPTGNPPQQIPLYLSSSFSFDQIEEGIDIFAGKETGYVYSRYGNPTIEAVADRLAQMEAFSSDLEPAAFLTSSGMAAIHVLLTSLLKAGDKILTQPNLYGGTIELLEKVTRRSGIEIVYASLEDMEAVDDLLGSDSSIRVVYLETPTNPTLTCINLDAIARVTRAHGRKSIVDNTFSTPYLQRPLQHGIDFVIHSTTKYLNGHGTGIAGAVIGRDRKFMKEAFWPVLKLTGATCNPFDAWLVANGIRTLSLRMDKHEQNAMGLAQMLSGHPKVRVVHYPGLPDDPYHPIARQQMKGFGGMLSFELKADLPTTLQFMNALQIPSLAPTLGDVDTLVLHPATSSHLRIPRDIREKEGITDGLIRVSVGIETLSDLMSDFDQALVSV